MKKIMTFVAALSVAAMSFGQGEMDAYRLSQNDLQGSARGQAMAGAFGALGGDITGVAINPAGIGVYRSSEIVANIGASVIGTNTKWNSDENSKSTSNLNFANIAYIGYYPLSQDKMSSLNFGFNFNRVKNFDGKYRASRVAMPTSLTDYIAYRTNGTPSSTWEITDNTIYNTGAPWLGILSWDAGLINQGRNNDEYVSILNGGELVNPTLNITEKGHISAYDFTIGADVRHRFYWGVTVSITDVDYSMHSDYAESFEGSGGFDLGNELITKGSGLQLKTGIIFRPIDELRLGLAYQSPVWYSLTDYYYAAMTPDGIFIDGNPAGMSDTPGDARTDYNLRTPSTLTLSAALVFGRNFILSADFDYRDYRYMNLTEPDGRNYTADNQYIDDDFKESLALRVGAEVKFTPRFAGRLGIATQTSPYKSDFSNNGDVKKEVMTVGTVPHFAIDENTTYLTTGLGFRFTPSFYMDAALVFRLNEGKLYAFSPMPAENLASEPADYTNVTAKALVTLGYKF
ncbi:MAG: hypothetical protein LBR64_06750 [Dysgonamonadaceae bacterium]|jgi:long-subunit fatty acid transport protein|nr:hypothetical protein [Dysgonamonadaceae bacterium]